MPRKRTAICRFFNNSEHVLSVVYVDMLKTAIRCCFWYYESS